MQLQNSSGKALSVFGLVMINVIAVDSLRSLTAGAEYGLALITFYLLAAVLFFIPTILVAAELATGWPNTGGVYVWVREAFGPRWGFLTIWMQWIYNVVWYPTIFAFIAGVIAYLIHPELTNNKFYMLTVILSSIWIATFINCLGLKASGFFSAIGAIIGTLLPMLFIAGLGIAWLLLKRPTHIEFHVKNFIPHFDNLTFFTNILYGLMGMEMSAVHAGDVQNPRRDYPRALLISGVIILATLITACLGIATVIPAKQLNLVSGLLDAFAIFFHAYHMDWFMPVIAILIILGSLSGAAAWIIGPARGLYVSTGDNDLPRWLKKTNHKNMPVGILMTQGIIVTLLSMIFLIMPSVSSSYWVLSNLTAQLALIFYIIMFAAAIRLRYKYPSTDRAYRIPGDKIGIWLVAGIGILTCLVTIGFGFLPPTQFDVGKTFMYESILVAGIIIFTAPAFLLHMRKAKS